MPHMKSIPTGTSLLLLISLLIGCSGGEGESTDDTVVIVDDTEDMSMPGQDMATTTPRPDMSRPVPTSTCGDATLDAQEACDDGNVIDGDGCSSECNLETVVIRNLEAQLTSARVIDSDMFCDNSPDPCEAGYSMSFTLQNYTNLGIDRLTYIRLTMGGHNITQSDYSCSFFELPPFGRSEVADVSIYYVRDRYGGSSKAGVITMDNFCGMNRELDLSFTNGLLNPVPLEDKIIELQMEGVLEDGALWSATAQTSIKDRR